MSLYPNGNFPAPNANPVNVTVKVGSGGGTYVLPPATNTTLGGVIVGANLTVDANGVLSGTGGYTLTPATNTTLGGVIIPDGGGLAIDAGGNLTATAQPLNPATNTTLGGVIIPDGGNLTVTPEGNLTVTNGAFMPYPNYNGTNLESVPFVGSGLADTSNTACSVAIGLIPEYNGYKVYGAFSNYNNTLQINGLTDIYTNGLLAPSLAAGNQANGTGGIYAVPGDCRLINTGNPQTSSSVVSKGYVDSKFGSLPYLNNSTTNSTYTFTDTSTDSRFNWQKASNANSTGSVRYEWLDNTGRYGTLQWILKPTTGNTNWVWGGLSINANTTNASRPTADVYMNYSDLYDAGNAYGLGVRIGTDDVTLVTNKLGSATPPTKVWSANSILTQSYADTRYSLVNTSVPLVSTTGTVFSSTSFTGGQFGYANATSGILTGVATVSGARYGQIQFRNNSNLTNTVRVSVNAAELLSMPANTGAPMSRVAVDQSAATLMYSDTFLNTAQLAISNTANGIVCLLQGVMAWQDDSVLTRTYADTRYVNEPANGTFTGTFLSQDGKTVTVQNGVIVSVA